MLRDGCQIFGNTQRLSYIACVYYLKYGIHTYNPTKKNNQNTIKITFLHLNCNINTNMMYR